MRYIGKHAFLYLYIIEYACNYRKGIYRAIDHACRLVSYVLYVYSIYIYINMMISCGYDSI